MENPFEFFFFFSNKWSSEKLFVSFEALNNGMLFLVHDHVIIQSIHSNHGLYSTHAIFSFSHLLVFSFVRLYVCMCFFCVCVAPKLMRQTHVTLIEYRTRMCGLYMHNSIRIHGMHGLQSKSRFPTIFSSTSNENSSNWLFEITNHFRNRLWGIFCTLSLPPHSSSFFLDVSP